MVLRRLGETYLAHGDIPAARTHLERSLAWFGGAQGTELSEALVALARSARLLGELDEASARIRDALEAARESGDRHDERRALEEQAEICRHLS
ncbi:hypothetical protein AB0O34_25125 [Sphaerisporangium sp. NPDC088356]|uniref:hypothetical protein n=1 Tax=Sphaerisporangium sp. NPDC088356 TaxID=3154871 RepID=UPI003435D91A